MYKVFCVLVHSLKKYIKTVYLNKNQNVLDRIARADFLYFHDNSIEEQVLELRSWIHPSTYSASEDGCLCATSRQTAVHLICQLSP